MEFTRTRRAFISLTVGLTAGCMGTSSVQSKIKQVKGLPEPASQPQGTEQPTVSEQPADLMLDSSNLPEKSGTSWNKTRTDRRDSTLSVNYEVFRDGTLSHQVTMSLTRRMIVDGAVFDHDKLVEYYTEEHDATVEEISLGDTGSIVTFGQEVHVIATHRNVVVHVVSYGGPREQVIEVARRQVSKLQQEVPRPS